MREARQRVELRQDPRDDGEHEEGQVRGEAGAVQAHSPGVLSGGDLRVPLQGHAGRRYAIGMKRSFIPTAYFKRVGRHVRIAAIGSVIAARHAGTIATATYGARTIAARATRSAGSKDGVRGTSG